MSSTLDDAVQAYLATYDSQNAPVPDGDRGPFADAVIRAVLSDPPSFRPFRKLTRVLPDASPEALTELLTSPLLRDDYKGSFGGHVALLFERASNLAAPLRAILQEAPDLGRGQAYLALLILALEAASRQALLEPELASRLIPAARSVAFEGPVHIDAVSRALPALHPEQRAALALDHEGRVRWRFAHASTRPVVIETATRVVADFGRHTRLEPVHVRAFMGFGPAGVEALRAALDDRPSTSGRRALVRLLTELSAHLPKALSALLTAACEGRKALRALATEALSERLEAEPEATLEATCAHILAASRHRKKTVRRNALDLAATLPPEPAVRAMAKRLVEARPERSERLAHLLDAPEPPPPPPEEALALEALIDTHRETALRVADAIRRYKLTEKHPRERWPEDLRDAPADALLAGVALWLEDASAFQLGKAITLLNAHADDARRPLFPYALIRVAVDAGSRLNDILETLSAHLSADEVAPAALLALSFELGSPFGPAYVLAYLSEHAPERLAHPDALAALEEAVVSKGKNIREIGHDAALAAGPAALPVLARVLATGALRERSIAARLLAEIAHPDALPILEAGLEGERSGAVKDLLRGARRAILPLFPASVLEDAPSAELHARLEAGMAEHPPTTEPPSRWKPAPALRWTSGAELSAAAMTWLQAQLASERPDGALEGVLDHTTRESRAAFADALERLGETFDGPHREVFARLGDDALIARMASDLDAMARNNQFADAAGRVHALRLSDTDAAIRSLDGLARTARSSGLRARAAEALKALAARLEETPEGLVERTFPDLGLNMSDALRLDLGGRALVARLERASAGFSVSLYDDAGARLTRFPAEREDDDHARYVQTRERLRALKDTAPPLLHDQVARLERAMVTGRSWIPERFRALFLEHPLGALTARGLLVAAGDVHALISDDLELLGPGGTPVALPDDTPVHIPHPLRLEPATRDAFLELAADAALEAPFAQLDRETIDDPADLDATIASAAPLTPRRVSYGLREMGYTLDRAAGGGFIFGARRELLPGWTLHIEHSGHHARAGQSEDTVRLRRASFLRGRVTVPPDEVPALLLTEALYDIRRLLNSRT